MTSSVFLRFCSLLVAYGLFLSMPLCAFADDDSDIEDIEDDPPIKGVTLWDLIMSGSLSEVEAFLDDKSSLELSGFVTERGETLLHLAALRGDPSVIRLLIEDYDLDPRAENQDGWMPIHVAVEQGHFDAVAMLVRALGEDCESSSLPPLYLAALRGDVPMLWLLFGAGHSLDFETPSGANVLHVVAQEGHVGALRALFAMGADEMIDDQDNEGWTPLFAAVLNGQEDVVAALIQAGADVTITTHLGVSALDFAVGKGYIGILRRLLEAIIVSVGSDDFNEVQYPLLHWAALCGDLNALRALVEAGGDLRKEDARGFTPLDYACYAFDRGLDSDALLAVMVYIRTCLQEDAVFIPLAEMPGLITDASLNARLLNAAWLGDFIAVTELLLEGADPFYVDTLGRTALHLAVAGGDVDVVWAILLAQENVQGVAVEIDPEDIDGQTPLEWAMDAYEDDPEDASYETIIQILVGRGAGLEVADGESFMHRAARQGWEMVVRLLIQAMELHPEQYLDLPNDEGFTPFQLAVRAGHIEVMELLAHAGFGLEVPEGLLQVVESYDTIEALRRLQEEYHDQAVHGVDALGFTRLHRAVAAGDRRKVEWLIQEGADVNALDPDGYTALYIAALNGYEDLVRCLVEAGALVGVVNHGGVDPRVLAQEGEYEGVIAWIDNNYPGNYIQGGIIEGNVDQNAYHPLIPAPNPRHGTRIFYYNSF